MSRKKIIYTKLSTHWKKPFQVSQSEAWSDLFSTEMYELQPLERKLFKTDISVQLPEWTYGRIAPRSWLAYKHGIDVLAWVVDCTYTGNIWVVLINLWQEPYLVHKWDRIAQIIIQPCLHVTRDEGDNLDQWDDELKRGESWFWSSGR